MGNFYLVTLADEDDAVYERGETNYIRIEIKDIYSSYAYINPSTVSISIVTLSCENHSTYNAMTQVTTGKYSYYHTIPASAEFGEYEYEIKITTPTYTQLYRNTFIILPFNAVGHLRKSLGVKETKSISQNDLAKVILEAYREALDDVYKFVEYEYPSCNPDTGEWFNGSNVTFSTKQSPLADHNGDLEVTGWGEKSCATDVFGLWQDSDGNCHRANITVKESQCGKIEIKQLDNTAIPSTAQWVHISYWLEHATYDEKIFREAVIQLAAHKCLNRFHELRRTTLADVEYNKSKFLETNQKMFYNEYLRLLNLIRDIPIGGAK